MGLICHEIDLNSSVVCLIVLAVLKLSKIIDHYDNGFFKNVFTTYLYLKDLLQRERESSSITDLFPQMARTELGARGFIPVSHVSEGHRLARSSLLSQSY